MKILGIDVGGTGIKSAIVETADATLVTEWHRRATPQPATPESIAQAIKEIVDDFGYSGTVGCCFPTVVIDGVATTAGNIDKSWRGTSIESTFESATGLPFVALNDADAAGIAEMELGAGRGLRGMVITITIGTGLGSGVFFEGMLIPNIELGRMPGKDGQPIEYYAGNRARKLEQLSWDVWGERFNYFLERVNRVMSPNAYILGGGASKHLSKYSDQINVSTPVRVAQFRNRAGIIGAAVAAERSLSSR